MHYIGRQVFNGRIEGKSVMFRKRTEIHFGHSARIEIPPRDGERALAKRSVRVADD